MLRNWLGGTQTRLVAMSSCAVLSGQCVEAGGEGQGLEAGDGTLIGDLRPDLARPVLRLIEQLQRRIELGILEGRDRRDLAAKGIAAAIEEDLADEVAAPERGVGIGKRDALGTAGGGECPAGRLAPRWWAGRSAGCRGSRHSRRRPSVRNGSRSGRSGRSRRPGSQAARTGESPGILRLALSQVEADPAAVAVTEDAALLIGGTERSHRTRSDLVLDAARRPCRRCRVAAEIIVRIGLEQRAAAATSSLRGAPTVTWLTIPPVPPIPWKRVRAIDQLDPVDEKAVDGESVAAAVAHRCRLRDAVDRIERRAPPARSRRRRRVSRRVGEKDGSGWRPRPLSSPRWKSAGRGLPCRSGRSSAAVRWAAARCARR